MDCFVAPLLAMTELSVADCALARAALSERGYSGASASSAGSAVDLLETTTSEAARMSRGEARLRRRALRALDILAASEKTLP